MKKLILALLLAGLLGGLAGCAAPARLQTSLSITFQDEHFLPGAFRVPAGQEITVTFNNQDAVPHEWTILVGDNSLDPAAFDQPFPYWSQALPAGSSQTITFTAPAAAGIYKTGCGLPGHAAEEMQGRLTVVQP